MQIAEFSSACKNLFFMTSVISDAADNFRSARRLGELDAVAKRFADFRISASLDFIMLALEPRRKQARQSVVTGAENSQHILATFDFLPNGFVYLPAFLRRFPRHSGDML